MNFVGLVAALLVWLAAFGSSAAEPARRAVEVTMFAVPESVWQTKFEGQFREHPALWMQLDVEAKAGRIERPLDAKCEVGGAEPFVFRKGSEREFVEGWVPEDPTTNEVTPQEKAKRFIGTTLQVTQEDGSDAHEAMRVGIELEHHLAEPAMQRINYANAAVGAEREKLSVAYPKFEKVTWQGDVFVWWEWRLVANLLRPKREAPDAAPAMRYLVFIKRNA